MSHDQPCAAHVAYVPSCEECIERRETGRVRTIDEIFEIRRRRYMNQSGATALLDQIERAQYGSRCPTCRTQGRELARLALLFAGITFVLGGFLGWGLHAWLT